MVVSLARNSRAATSDLKGDTMTEAEREARRAHWREIIDRWSESGLTKAGFCREHDLSIWQFHYWFGRFGPRDSATGFARIEPGGGSGVQLRLSSGLGLELSAGFDETVLARFLSVASRTC